MDKNTIIAIVVIFALVFAFQLIFLRPKVQETYEQKAEEAIEEIEEETVEEIASERKEPLDLKAAEGFEEAGEAQERVINVDTEHYAITLTTAGANVLSIRLLDYLDSDGNPVELVEADEEDVLPFETHFDRLKNVPFGDRALYHLEEEGDSSSRTYTFYRYLEDSNGNPFRFSKTYIFQNDKFMFDMIISAVPLGEKGLYLNNDSVSYTLAWGPLLGPISVVRNRYNITRQGYYEAGKFHKVFGGAGGCSLRRGESKYSEISHTIDWVGVVNRYFMVAVVPDARSYIYAFDQRTAGKYFLGISAPYYRGESLDNSFKVYIGPKDRKLLREYGYNFESVLSARVLKPIVIFLEWMIATFYSFTGSYGLAIILMTITIKIILHPLTFKSFQSMRKMSALQPKINEIREKYKNNQTQMNKEIQAMYRKEKVNPMGGCLPMILQLPIFYGLYTALSGMIELRNASFLWIRNLSLPDSVATIKTALPMLGYRIEGQGFTDINILPFVMTATTLLQTKLTSGNQGNQQGKMMTYLFPVVFFFIFWNMPSGLVLYWTIQNILTIGQQYFIDYRMKKKGQLQPSVKKK